LMGNQTRTFPQQHVDFDLFRDAVSTGRGRRGRPPHVPTPKNVGDVKELRRMGLTQGSIAKALGVSEKTLRRHYSGLIRGRNH
jgi:DNA-binding NarL/FixJ family response regulator